MDYLLNGSWTFLINKVFIKNYKRHFKLYRRKVQILKFIFCFCLFIEYNIIYYYIY